MLLSLLAIAVVAGVMSIAGVASAHECGYDPENPEECRETTVMPNWRGTYIPLFDLADREDEEQRADAQRWREECNSGDPNSPDYQSRQECQWAYGGFSLFQNRNDPERSPNELHVGFAATHCFLFEAAHQCEDHDISYGEGVHDAHGGAIYADVCLTPNPESKYCDEGMKDTQVGLTIMDHNPCGTFVPIVACTDEYKLVRPFDDEYTNTQMDNSQRQTQEIIDDPYTWICGYEQYGDCFLPSQQEAERKLDPSQRIPQ